VLAQLVARQQSNDDGFLKSNHLLANGQKYNLDQWCPTFLTIGQIFETKSLGGQVLDL
jgi:hypothetical protein